jgi:hypothetical protein
MSALRTQKNVEGFERASPQLLALADQLAETIRGACCTPHGLLANALLLMSLGIRNPGQPRASDELRHRAEIANRILDLLDEERLAATDHLVVLGLLLQLTVDRLINVPRKPCRPTSLH